MVRPLEPDDSALLGGDRHVDEPIENRCAPFYEAGWRAGAASTSPEAPGSGLREAALQEAVDALAAMIPRAFCVFDRFETCGDPFCVEARGDRDAILDRLAAEGPPAPLDAFVAAAAGVMRERLDHGARKFGALSWREFYLDSDNRDRLRRAVTHLVAARRNSDDPAEWAKRAADVANQAFMYADPERQS